MSTEGIGLDGYFTVEALNVAVHNYIVLAKAPGPESAAAFGIACGHLMETLNITIGAAAELLRAELDRRKI